MVTRRRRDVVSRRRHRRVHSRHGVTYPWIASYPSKGMIARHLLQWTRPQKFTLLQSGQRQSFSGSLVECEGCDDCFDPVEITGYIIQQKSKRKYGLWIIDSKLYLLYLYNILARLCDMQWRRRRKATVGTDWLTWLLRIVYKTTD